MNSLNFRMIGFCLLIFIVKLTSAQTLHFTYDAAGNRTGRNIPAKNIDATSPSIYNPESGELTAEYQSMVQNEVEPASQTVKPAVALHTDNSLPGHAITIYPNPTRGELVVKMENPGSSTQSSIAVSNANGTELLRQSGLQTFNPVDLTNYPVGVYILTISVDGKSTVWKVVRE